MVVCTFNNESPLTYIYVLSTVDALMIFPSIIFTVGFYIAIFLKFQKSRHKVQSKRYNLDMSESQIATQTLAPSKTTTKSKFSNENKDFSVTLNLFVVWAAFIVFWVPVLLLVKIYNFQAPLGIWYHVTFAFASANSMINFIIYGVMNKSFRAAYFRLLGCK